MTDTFNCPKCGQTLKILPLRSTTVEQDAVFMPDAVLPSTTPNRGHYKGFWGSLAVNDALIGVYAGGGVYLLTWVFDVPAVWAVITGFVVGVGAYMVRVVLYVPRVQQQPNNGPTTTVRVEQVSEDKTKWVMRDFNEAITLDDLQKVARACLNWGEWSRKVTTKQAHLSQGKHNKLQDDLVKLWYIEPLPNNANGYQITRQGRRFFEAVTSIPQK